MTEPTQNTTLKPRTSYIRLSFWENTPTRGLGRPELSPDIFLETPLSVEMIGFITKLFDYIQERMKE